MTKVKLHDIGEKEIQPVFDKLPQENVMSMDLQLQFHALQSKMPMSQLLAKWEQYVDMCVKEGRESKYIKRFTNFMNEKMYLHEFVYQNKSGGIAKTWLEGLP